MRMQLANLQHPCFLVTRRINQSLPYPISRKKNHIPSLVNSFAHIDMQHKLRQQEAVCPDEEKNQNNGLAQLDRIKIEFQRYRLNCIISTATLVSTTPFTRLLRDKRALMSEM